MTEASDIEQQETPLTPSVPVGKQQWYVLHVLSGQEARVKDRITRQVALEELGHLVHEILIPMETVAEVRAGKKSETKRKFYPGYVLANIDLLDEAKEMNKHLWHVIQQVDGVIGFTGSRTAPVPMRAREVEPMLAQIRERSETTRPKVAFTVGDHVTVKDGAFEGQEGIIEEVDFEKGKLRVSVEIFGRSTLLDLEYWQVHKEK